MAKKRLGAAQKRALKVLEDLDTFFTTERSDSARRMVWNVLAALRGPDQFVGKSELTIPIRRGALPKLAEQVERSGKYRVGASFGLRGFDYLRRDMLANESIPRHFRLHASSALEALETLGRIEREKQ